MRVGGWNFTGCSFSFDSEHKRNYTALVHMRLKSILRALRLTKNTDCSAVLAVPLDSFHGLTGDH